jgi:hypothetical protein
MNLHIYDYKVRIFTKCVPWDFEYSMISIFSNLKSLHKTNTIAGTVKEIKSCPCRDYEGVHGAWSVLRPGRLTSWGRAPGTHWIGGCVGPGACLAVLEKKKFLSAAWIWSPGSSRTYPSQCTDCTTHAARVTSLTFRGPCIVIFF